MLLGEIQDGAKPLLCSPPSVDTGHSCCCTVRFICISPNLSLPNDPLSAYRAWARSSTLNALCHDCPPPAVVPPYDYSQCIECPLGARCDGGALMGLVEVLSLSSPTTCAKSFRFRPTPSNLITFLLLNNVFSEHIELIACASSGTWHRDLLGSRRQGAFA
jgi:hypothetical protein